MGTDIYPRSVIMNIKWKNIHLLCWNFHILLNISYIFGYPTIQPGQDLLFQLIFKYVVTASPYFFFPFLKRAWWFFFFSALLIKTWHSSASVHAFSFSFLKKDFYFLKFCHSLGSTREQCWLLFIFSWPFLTFLDAFQLNPNHCAFEKLPNIMKRFIEENPFSVSQNYPILASFPFILKCDCWTLFPVGIYAKWK